MVTFRTSSPIEEVRADRVHAALRAAAPTVVVAGIVFWLGYNSGTYSLTSRSAVAIVVWWAIVLAAALLSGSFRRIGRAATVTGISLAGLALWSLASTQWAPNAAAAFAEFDRVALVVGVFLVTVLWCTRRQLTRWCDGIALGVTGIVLLALASRFFPSVVAHGSALKFLQVGGTRLSYPVGYWNGLGALAALATPLLLRLAISGARPAVRGLALAALPAYVATTYLTSSRGAAIEMGVALFVFFVFSPGRVRTAVAIVAGAAATIPIAAYMAHAPTLVNGPLDGHAARHEGAVAAAILVLSSLLLGLAYAWGLRVSASHLPSTARVERPLLVFVLVLAVVGIVASNPAARFHDFKYAPVASGAAAPTVSQHLFSSSGNGRWQMWTVAAREFRQHPLLGGGAGSFEERWARYRPSPTFVKNAHSLYAETLGELGIVGLLLVLGFVVTPIAVGLRRRLRARGEHAATLAALLAGFAAYAAAAGLDWVWQIPGVTLPAIVLLGLLVAPSSAAPPIVDAGRRPISPAVRIGVVVVGIAIVAAEAIPMLAQVQLDASHAAALRGAGGTALRHARSAEAIEPWSPDPYEQVALLQEQIGDLSAAKAAIRDAIARDDSDWQLWLVRARLETKSGEIRQAAASLARAKQLNPIWAAQLTNAAGP